MEKYAFQDIRSFFSISSKKKAVNNGLQSVTTPPVPLVKRKVLAIISSDEEDNSKTQDTKRLKKISTAPHKNPETNFSAKKRLHIIDSDDEEEDPSTKNIRKKPSLQKSSVQPSLKAVNVDDIFGSEPIKRVERPKSQKKSISTLTEEELGSHFNDDNDLVVIDESLLNGSLLVDDVPKLKPEIKKSSLNETVISDDVVIGGTPEVKRVATKSKTPKTKEFQLNGNIFLYLFIYLNWLYINFDLPLYYQIVSKMKIDTKKNVWQQCFIKNLKIVGVLQIQVAKKYQK